MKITKSQLKQIIREELEAALGEDKRGSDAVATYSGDRPEGWENCGPKDDSHEWRSCNQRNHNRNRVTEQATEGARVRLQDTKYKTDHRARTIVATVCTTKNVCAASDPVKFRAGMRGIAKNAAESRAKRKLAKKLKGQQ